MRCVEVMRLEADLAYNALESTCEGISESVAWAAIAVQEGEYLHTNGSIIGIVQHIAVCKVMYASTAFRNTEIRWRDAIARIEAIGTSWQGSREYLAEAHRYWLDSWADLNDLSAEVAHFRGSLMPAWRILAIMSQHDAHHGGQIAMLGSALAPASSPPDMDYDGERKHLVDLPGW